MTFLHFKFDFDNTNAAMDAAITLAKVPASVVNKLLNKYLVIGTFKFDNSSGNTL